MRSERRAHQTRLGPPRYISAVICTAGFPESTTPPCARGQARSGASRDQQPWAPQASVLLRLLMLAQGTVPTHRAAPEHQGLSVPFGIHCSKSCTEHQIWLTTVQNFQGVTWILYLVPGNQGHRNGSPCSPCAVRDSHAGLRGTGKVGQAGPQTIAPHLGPRP